MAILAQNLGSQTAWRRETIIAGLVSIRDPKWHAPTSLDATKAPSEPGAHDDLLRHDVRALLGADNPLSTDADAPFRFRDRLSSASYALALGHRDLVAVLKPNPDRRDNTRIQFKYFGKCSGCQYQMLAYEKQLESRHTATLQARRLLASSRCSRATKPGPVTSTNRPAHDLVW